MENDNKELNERQVRIPQNSKEKSYRLTIFVLSVILLACVLFSGFQSVYIFKLNSGREGILSYTRTGSTTTETTSEVTEETEDKPAEERPEPWFSLEDAAYVPSADKTRMTTVEIAKQVSPATVSLKVIGVDNDTETVIGSGTGFIITDDGYIVTNQHVVVLAEEAVSTYYVTVVLPGDDLPVRAEVVGSDAQTDIAVIKVDTDKKLPCVKLGDSDLLQAGEEAYAAMRRSTNGGGENSPLLTGEDDYYELFMEQLAGLKSSGS